MFESPWGLLKCRRVELSKDVKLKLIEERIHACSGPRMQKHQLLHGGYRVNVLYVLHQIILLLAALPSAKRMTQRYHQTLSRSGSGTAGFVK